MTDNNVGDGTAKDFPPAPKAQPKPKPKAAPKARPAAGAPTASHGPSGESGFQKAVKQVEDIGQTLGEVLQGRGNVVMVRVNDDMLRSLDQLVDAEIAKSRSESAAFLISEGIQANKPLFNKIGNIADQINRLKAQLRDEIKKNVND
jgi:hypothetical protein